MNNPTLHEIIKTRPRVSSVFRDYTAWLTCDVVAGDDHKDATIVFPQSRHRPRLHQSSKWVSMLLLRRQRINNTVSNWFVQGARPSCYMPRADGTNIARLTLRERGTAVQRCPFATVMDSIAASVETSRRASIHFGLFWFLGTDDLVLSWRWGESGRWVNRRYDAMQ